jgi:hypothetical protein
MQVTVKKQASSYRLQFKFAHRARQVSLLQEEMEEIVAWWTGLLGDNEVLSCTMDVFNQEFPSCVHILEHLTEYREIKKRIAIESLF